MAVVDEDILSNLDLSNWNQETKETAQVVLTVDETEDLPGSVRPTADKAAERKYPGKSSNIKIAELLELVKGDAEKYISKQEIVREASDESNPDIRYSRELETVEELKQQNELLKKQVDYWHSAGRKAKKERPWGVKRSIEFENEATGEQGYDRMKANKQTVAQMETVASVPGYDGALKASDLIQAVSEFFTALEMPLKMKSSEGSFCRCEA